MDVALIIDDNRQTADTLREMLQMLGIEAMVAYGASAGLGALKISRPGAIFLDLNMPGVDGFEILGYMHREPRLSNVPVVVVTSDDQPETARRVQEMNVKAMIIKPVMLETLEAAVKRAGLV
ncbi:MAG: response regulator [Chloroflexota bacterium]